MKDTRTQELLTMQLADMATYGMPPNSPTPDDCILVTENFSLFVVHSESSRFVLAKHDGRLATFTAELDKSHCDFFDEFEKELLTVPFDKWNTDTLKGLIESGALPLFSTKFIQPLIEFSDLYNTTGYTVYLNGEVESNNEPPASKAPPSTPGSVPIPLKDQEAPELYLGGERCYLTAAGRRLLCCFFVAPKSPTAELPLFRLEASTNEKIYTAMPDNRVPRGALYVDNEHGEEQVLLMLPTLPDPCPDPSSLLFTLDAPQYKQVNLRTENGSLIEVETFWLGIDTTYAISIENVTLFAVNAYSYRKELKEKSYMHGANLPTGSIVDYVHLDINKCLYVPNSGRSSSVRPYYNLIGYRNE